MVVRMRATVPARRLRARHGRTWFSSADVSLVRTRRGRTIWSAPFGLVRRHRHQFRLMVFCDLIVSVPGQAINQSARSGRRGFQDHRETFFPAPVLSRSVPCASWGKDCEPGKISTRLIVAPFNLQQQIRTLFTGYQNIDLITVPGANIVLFIRLSIDVTQAVNLLQQSTGG